MAPRDTENNAYAKFWGDKQRALWYVMVFLESSFFVLFLFATLETNREGIGAERSPGNCFWDNY